MSPSGKKGLFLCFLSLAMVLLRNPRFIRAQKHCPEELSEEGLVEFVLA